MFLFSNSKMIFNLLGPCENWQQCMQGTLCVVRSTEQWGSLTKMPLYTNSIWEINLLWSSRASLVAQLVKNLHAVQETQVWSLGGEDPLEKGMATHSNILFWRIPWAEELGRLQSIDSLQRVRHDWCDWARMHACMQTKHYGIKVIHLNKPKNERSISVYMSIPISKLTKHCKATISKVF